MNNVRVDRRINLIWSFFSDNFNRNGERIYLSRVKLYLDYGAEDIWRGDKYRDSISRIRRSEKGQSLSQETCQKSISCCVMPPRESVILVTRHPRCIAAVVSRLRRLIAEVCAGLYIHSRIRIAEKQNADQQYRALLDPRGSSHVGVKAFVRFRHFGRGDAEKTSEFSKLNVHPKNKKCSRRYINVTFL